MEGLFYETVERNPYIPRVPFRKQIEWLTLPDEEAFYGGQAGGGKSDALLMAALQYVEYEDYGALLLRRTLKEHKKKNALIERSHKWLDKTDAHWNGTDYIWTFPNGASLEFGYLSNEKDLDQYDGPEYQFIGFDELTTFTEYQYTYMFGRLRRLVNSDIPIRMRGASNPGKIGHKWVKDRFVRGPFTFIPASYRENPYIDTELYERSLDKLPYVVRKQKKDGDWDIGAEGGLYNRLWFNLVEHISYNNIEKVVRYWDLAATEYNGENDPDYTVGLLGIKYTNQRMLVADVIRDRLSPYKTDELIKRVTERDSRIYAPNYYVYFEQEPGAGSKRDLDKVIKMLAGYKADIDKVSSNKEERAAASSSYAEHGNIDVIDTGWNSKGRGWTDEFLEELDFFPDNTEHDDQVDGFSGAFNKLFPIDKSIRPGMQAIDLNG